MLAQSAKNSKAKVKLWNVDPELLKKNGAKFKRLITVRKVRVRDMAKAATV